MTFDTSNPTYQELLGRVLQSGASVVPFVGAGLSVYGRRDERLPLWRELLERLIAEGLETGLIPDDGDPVINAALAARQYIRATDLILDALGEPTFRRVIQRELDDRHLEVPPAIAQLVGISWSLIVTTNLDRLIARAYLDHHGRPIRTITSLDTHALAAALAGSATDAEPSLAQIHGDIDVYPSWRLTQSHYEQLLRDPGYMEALKHLFLRKVFFVGFGLQDGDFDLILETVAHIYPAGVGEFYALIERGRKGDPVIQRLARENGLRPVFYDVDPSSGPDDPFAGHREVFECLAHLASSWAATETKLEVKLKYFPELDPFVVGRDQEIDLLASLLETEAGGIVQLVALGGAGKTSLVQRFLEARAAPLAAAGYRQVFGCSFYRADIGQFIHDMAIATVGALALPLPEQADRICKYVESNRVLLVLDGVEAILDDRSQLTSPYITRIVESVLHGRGACLATSRVPIRGERFELAATIDIEPLSTDEILAFLDEWGLNAIGRIAQRRLVEITAGHPLALRILAGVLLSVPPQDAVETIERSSAVDVHDEIDPLRENRLARVLGSYVHHLGEAELAFLVTATAFEAPAMFFLYEAALTRAYHDTDVNLTLVDQDLRPVVALLIERRLLTVGTGGELSSHPTVRDYFAARARDAGQSLVPIHHYLAAEYLRDASATPETFEDAVPLLTAARHAASAHDWTLFDDLFRRRLMRGFRSHLCNNLGAWDEALALARLGDDPTFPAALTPEPAYYPANVARCLKHLGRSSESRAKYFDALTVAATSRDPDTAKYVNNFLTLLVWRGELSAADALVELNVRALSWIDKPWKHHWQVEHGYSTIAYLRMLQGDLSMAATLFDFARRAWDDHDGERLWTYDYYPYYRSELTLLADPGAHKEALEQIKSLLLVAEAHRWPESLSRGNIQIADIHLDRAARENDATALIDANQRLDYTDSIPAGLNVPVIEIAYLVSRLKAELVRRSLHGPGSAKPDDFAGIVGRIEALVQTSALEWARPEAIASRGALAYLNGAGDDAALRYRQALEVCRVQGNWLAARSPRSLVHWLGEQTGQTPDIKARTSEPNPIELLGRSLSSDWMHACLETLRDRHAPTAHDPER
jgi:tetratricopeptide (TPR) repeat protein